MRTAAPRSRALALGIGVLAAALALVAGPIARSDAARGWFVDGPLQQCAEHADGPPDYNAGRLGREFERLRDRLRTCGIALALAAFCVAVTPLARRGRGDALAAVLLGAGLVTGAVVAVDQFDVVSVALDRGLAGASREERFAALYPDATRAARALTDAVAPDSRVLVIDFADPDHLHVFGYVAFPIRIHTPADPLMRFDANTFRTLLRTRPDVARECAARRYAAVVDLRALVAGDARAIIHLAADGSERP